MQLFINRLNQKIMSAIRNKGDTRFGSNGLTKSNLMHNYYAVNSVDGIKYLPQAIKVNNIRLAWKSTR